MVVLCLWKRPLRGVMRGARRDLWLVSPGVQLSQLRLRQRPAGAWPNVLLLLLLLLRYYQRRNWPRLLQVL